MPTEEPAAVQPRVVYEAVEGAIFRIQDLRRFGAECTCFPPFPTHYFPKEKTRQSQKRRHFRIQGRNAIACVSYHVGKEQKVWEKAPVPLRAIYPDVKRVVDASGKPIARRKTRDHPLRWVKNGKKIME